MVDIPLLPSTWPSLPLADVARLAPVQTLHWPLLNDLGIEIAIKREDLLHPQLGGNKFYKLDGHLRTFAAAGAQSLLSFGGAYSNHLYALAAAGQALAIPTLGVIRGERPPVFGATLADLTAMGMQLVFVSREEYRSKEDPAWQVAMRRRFPDAYWIAEGGGDLIGARGCALWATAALDMCPWPADRICLATGTGGTAAGVLAGSQVPVHAFLALKGEQSEVITLENKILTQARRLRASMPDQRQDLPSLYLESNYHCGGYARFPAQLREFTAKFEAETALPLDPVYTAKLFWGIADKARSGHWSPGTRILVLHSGGLQGKRGFGAA